MASGAKAEPLRACIGCRRKAPRAELVRIVRTETGELAVGRALRGRGAWLCAGRERCFELAQRRRAFSRAFLAPVEAAAIESLRAQLLGETGRNST